MIPIDLRPAHRFSRQHARRVWLSLIILCVPAFATGQTRVWEIDFSDPEEVNRWKRYPFEDFGGDIDWNLVPVSASDPHGPKMLQVSVTIDLGIKPWVTIYREFPPDFNPDPAGGLILEWDWKIKDTLRSDWVMLGITREPFRGDRADFGPEVFSHSRYTKAWRIFFDPSNEWVHHRVGIRSGLGSTARPPGGICLQFMYPVQQTFSLASLRVEERPRNQVEHHRVFGPHHAPRPRAPFSNRPHGALLRCQAGALEDLDGDGLPELLVMEREGYAHLYRNDGTGRFVEEITEPAGLGFSAFGLGAMLLDLDGDGDRDLMVSAELDAPRFFENLGSLRFIERTLLGDEHLSYWYGAAADDIDGDGDVDVFLANPYKKAGFLYLENNGSWQLQPAPLVDPESLPDAGGRHRSASVADIDNDGWPEVFVSREHLYRNEQGRLLLIPEPWRDWQLQPVEGGLLADLTGDGEVDLLILRDSLESTTGLTRLFAGDGSGGFVKRAKGGAIPPLESAEVALAEDFDCDGDLDLYIGQEMRPNLLLLNDGSGVFEDATARSGFIDGGGCTGAVAGDLDGDGGMDVVIFRHAAPLRILHNRLERGHWLGVVIEGREPATDGIGTRVQIRDRASGELIQTRWVRRGRGFGPTGPAELRFGLGPRIEVDLEVRFPGGETRRLEGVPADTALLIRQESGGFAGRLGDRIAEWRFPLSRQVKQRLGRRPGLAWWIAGTAFLLGLLVALPRLRTRFPAAFLLFAGEFAAIAVGWIPGRGIGGAPPLQWPLGALMGVLLPLAGSGALRVRRRLREQKAPAPVPPEELIRYTHDFRHSGLETRALLSLRSRLQNLFLNGGLHRPFLEELLQLAHRLPESTSPRLRRLVEIARGAFPGTHEAARLQHLTGQLESLARELDGLVAHKDMLRTWQRRILSVTAELQDSLAALLTSLDRLCSCDLAAALEEALSIHADDLRSAGVEVDLHHELASPALAVLITRDHLLLILENLFTNSICALEGGPEKRIEISAAHDRQRVTLEFRDNGPGVPSQDAKKIFEHGFSTRQGGKGYGLARSREILGHFGGSIQLAEPALGRGACFLLRLRMVPGSTVRGVDPS